MALLLTALTRPAYAAHELVLIVNARSTVAELDATATQRLFLGLSIARNGVRLRPVLNESDPQIAAIFLKNIVAMSRGTYDRFILRLALLQGRTEPATYYNAHDVIEAVAADPTAVGYVWSDDVIHDPRVKMLRIVGHD